MKNYSNRLKNIILIFCIFTLIVFAFSLLSAYERLGYLFRYNTVELRYDTTEDTLKIHHINYQTVITQSIDYNGSPTKNKTANLSKADVNLSSTGNIKSDLIDIQYPYTITTNKNEFLDVNESVLSITKAKDIFDDEIVIKEKDDAILLNFNTPVKLYDFTRSVEFSVFSSIYPLIIEMNFVAYNKNGVKILSFKQEIKPFYKNQWYFESFNLLADNRSTTIENLYLTGIDFTLPKYAKSVDEDVRISLSDLRCVNTIKKPGWENLQIKREYAVFEKIAQEWDWKLRIGNTPSTLDDVGEYIPNNDSTRIKNAENWYFEFNKDVLSSYDYLLIDFKKDFFVPADNRLTALVRGRGMGEEVGFIFEDSRGIYYELNSGNLDFEDWKSLEFVSPASKYLSYIDKKTKTPFVKLLGLKINPGYDGKIGIAIDDISSIMVH